MRKSFLGAWIRSLQVMFGAKPQIMVAKDLHDEEAKEIHLFKRGPEERKRRLQAIEDEKKLKLSHKWRNRRWFSIIFINAIFILSFQADVQLVEGAMTGSRVLGFHFADLNSALQVMLASKEVVVNLLIGTGTVLFLWWLLGGRSFCSWACPYHLIAEWAEMIHLWAAKRGWAKEHKFDRGMRTVLFVIFLALAFFTGYTIFEMISPVGIISRALVYGPGIALFWVGILLLIEIFYSRRFWCRYVCPIGMVYGFVGTVSPVGVEYDLDPCLHEGECLQVCMVPHVLQVTKLGQSPSKKVSIGADCTRCGMCIDACPTGALKYKVKGLDILT
jgi:ferredoxin-type protein NapH